MMSSNNYSDDVYIAAKGGALHSLVLNMKPDGAIGDFDYVDASELERLVSSEVINIEHPPRKD